MYSLSRLLRWAFDELENEGTSFGESSRSIIFDTYPPKFVQCYTINSNSRCKSNTSASRNYASRKNIFFKINFRKINYFFIFDSVIKNKLENIF
jgi:hypothetical protein